MLLKSILFAALFSTSGASSDVSNLTTIKEVPNKEISTAISHLVKNIEFRQVDLPKSQRIKVTFMLNDKTEIVVLSTDNPEFDYQLKNALNYKRIDEVDVAPYTIYIVPIVLEL